MKPAACWPWRIQLIPSRNAWLGSLLDAAGASPGALVSVVDESATETVSRPPSSQTTVPMPTPSPISALPVVSLRVTVKFSSPSPTGSPFTVILMTLLLSRGANVSVPDVAT